MLLQFASFLMQKFKEVLQLCFVMISGLAKGVNYTAQLWFFVDPVLYNDNELSSDPYLWGPAL